MQGWVMGVQVLASLIWLLFIDLLSSRLTTTKSVKTVVLSRKGYKLLGPSGREDRALTPPQEHTVLFSSLLSLYKFISTRRISVETHKLTPPRAFETSSTTEPGNEAFQSVSKCRKTDVHERKINMEITPAGVGRDLI